MSYLGTPPNEDIVSNVKEYIATAGQTVFEVIYDNYAEVSLNGTQLASSDYAMNNGISITLAVGASAGDIVQCTGYESFKYNNTVDTITSQTIGGVKTFTYSPVIPDAININEPLSKGQLLTAIKAVDGAGSGLDADTVDGVQGALLGVGGAGYAWVDETANRASGVTYTNTTGHPIVVCVSSKYGTNATVQITFYVNGQIIISNTMYGQVLNEKTGKNSVTVIIPNGATYKSTLTQAILYWSELK